MPRRSRRPVAPRALFAKSSYARRLRAEQLEDRRMLAITVDTTSDVVDAADGVTSLREAIIAANTTAGPDEIDFGPLFSRRLTIPLASQLPTITDDLTIVGPGRDLLTLDAGDGADGLFSTGDGFRLFDINDGNPDQQIDVTLRGLTLTGGDTANGIDQAGEDGGAIRSTENLTLADSTITGNATGDGGGGYSGYNGGRGGGVYSSGALTVVRSTISDNRTGVDFAAGFGGGDGAGGGIYSTGVLTVTDSTIRGNATGGAAAGGGGRGGGIFSRGVATVTYSTIADNVTTNSGQGGGIYSRNDLTIAHSTISGNTAGAPVPGEGAAYGGQGGGVFSRGGLTVSSSTLSGNTATRGNGGGIFAASTGLSSVTSSTITGNSATGAQGGGVFTYNAYDPTQTSPSLAINNTIIAGNTDSGTAPDLRPDPVDGSVISHSLIGDTTGSGVDATTGVGNLLNVDPLLGPLADNGGPTRTHALLVGSPAINAGDPSLTGFDQRGLPRHVGGVDIGAYEDQMQPSLVVTTRLDVVDATDGVTSLREAILTANSTVNPREITFDPTVFVGGFSSLIRLTEGELEITDTLTIDGSTGVGVTITGDALGDDVVDDNFLTSVFSSDGLLDDNSRVLNFTATTGDLTLESLTITGGRVTGGSMTGGNPGDLGGGGVRFASEGTLTLTSSTVRGNNTSGYALSGGGVAVASGTLAIVGSTISDNAVTGYASRGGGLWSDQGVVTLTGSTVSDNHTTEEASPGGGIATRSGDVTLNNSTVSGNVTLNGGPAGRPNMLGASPGGGIHTYSGAIRAYGSTVRDNTANAGYGSFSASGGGIATYSGVVSLTESTVRDNTVDGYSARGGGVHTSIGSVTLERSTITGNQALGYFGSYGGGIASRSGAVIANNSTLSGNTSYALYISRGGGVYTREGVLTLTSSTVTGNRASVTPGAGGEYEASGGGVYARYATGAASLSTRSTIITGNTTNGTLPGAAPDLRPAPGAPLEVDFSLIGDTAGSGVDAMTGVGNLLNVDPLLGPLADNGGPTLTHALLVGSPAINAGDPSLTGSDQRGLPRNAGSPDIGAFEAQTESESLVVTTTADVVDSTDFVTSLREAVAFANSQAGPDEITFDFGTDGPATVFLTEGELTVTDSLVIAGDGQALLTIDAQGLSRHFVLDDGLADNLIDVTLSGLTLTGGKAANGPDGVATPARQDAESGGAGANGGAIFSVENLTLVNSSITGSAAGDGGQGANFLDGAAYEGFRAGNGGVGGYGGAIYSNGGALTLIRSTLSGNRAGAGGDGGESFDYYGIGGNGGAGGSGGGVFIRSGSLTISDSVLTGNASGDGGDGAEGGSGGGYDAVLAGVGGNGANAGAGGGVAALLSTSTITGTVVSGNLTGAGGAGGLSDRLGDYISGGRGGHGGGLYQRGGEFSVVNSTLSGNRLGSDDLTFYLSRRYSRTGGGLFTHSGALSLSGSTVSGNQGYYSSFPTQPYPAVGVAVGTTGSSAPTQATITNSTISGNRSGVERSSGQVDIRSSTIANNQYYGSGFGIGDAQYASSSGGFSISSSLLAGNGDGERTLRNLESLGHNLIGPGETRLIAALTAQPTDLVGVDPLLGPLADNGGPTQTHALLPGSPAINAGDPSLTGSDQRGLPRSAGSPDIGAFEAQTESEGLVVTTTTDVVDSTDFVTSLREAVAFANSLARGFGIGEQITFDLGDAPQTILLTQGAIDLVQGVNLIGPGSELLTIDASGNDPTPDQANGDGSAALTIAFTQPPQLPPSGPNVYSTTISGVTITGADSLAAIEDGSYTSETTLRDTVITGNKGSGFYHEDRNYFGEGNRVRVFDSVITGNTGAGVRARSLYQVTDLRIEDSDVSDNGQSGIVLTGIDLLVTRSVVSGNGGRGVNSDFRIGGLSASGYYGGSVGLTDSVVSGNSGGGIGASSAGIIRSTIEGNGGVGVSAFGEYPYDGFLQVTSSTISGNRGGVTSSQASIRSSTIANNRDFAIRGDAVITSSIFAGNGGGTSLYSLESGGHNLIAPNETALIESLTPTTTDLVGVDPLLGPLADNGGRGRTHALLPGSPALDAIAPPAELVTPTAVVSAFAGTDLFPAENLINNSGLASFPTTSNYETVTHARATDQTGWVTDQAGGPGTDYFDFGPDPVLTFSLAEERTLTDLVVWGYDLDRPHNNEASTFLVEFSTDGGVTYSDSVTVEHQRTATEQETINFGQTFQADTVRLTITDNHAGTPGADGGGRVGLGEVKVLARDNDPAFDQRGEPYSRLVGVGIDIGAYEAQGPVTRVPGDYNGDNVVNTADYAVWRDAFDPETPVAPLTGADGDGDGFVTRRDRDVWLSHIGFTFTPPEAPPAAELVAEAPPLEQPAFLEAEPETEPETDTDAAFALFIASPTPTAADSPATAAPTVAAEPVADDNLLLLAFATGNEEDTPPPEFAALDDAFSEEEEDDLALVAPAL